MIKQFSQASDRLDHDWLSIDSSLGEGRRVGFVGERFLNEAHRTFAPEYFRIFSSKAR